MPRNLYVGSNRVAVPTAVATAAATRALTSDPLPAILRYFPFPFFFGFAPARSGRQRSVSVVRVCGPRRREPRGHRARELCGGLCGSPRGRSRREQTHNRRHQCGYRCVRVVRT